jgi:hypothetical protein
MAPELPVIMKSQRMPERAMLRSSSEILLLRTVREVL